MKSKLQVIDDVQCYQSHKRHRTRLRTSAANSARRDGAIGYYRCFRYLLVSKAWWCWRQNVFNVL